MSRYEDKIKDLNHWPSPDDVARFLLASGFTGRPTDSSYCPVARYLLAGEPDEVRVGVTRNWTKVWEPDAVQPARIAYEGSLSEFIKKFDRGEYPELMVTYE